MTKHFNFIMRFWFNVVLFTLILFKVLIFVINTFRLKEQQQQKSKTGIYQDTYMSPSGLCRLVLL